MGRSSPHANKMTKIAIIAYAWAGTSSAAEYRYKALRTWANNIIMFMLNSIPALDDKLLLLL